MAPDDRERNFERALARNLRANVTGGAPASSVGCPDAEILAAYHERLLTPEEMISRKEHIASCMRCQEILAHLEATDEILVEPADLVKDEGLTPQSLFATASMRIPSVPRASSSPSAYEVTPKSAVPLEIRRRTANWRWLAPAGALAAILLVWVAAHERTDGIDADDLDFGIFLFQILADTTDSAAGADAANEVGYFSFGVVPDFRAGGEVMRLGIHGIVVLVRIKGIRRFAGQFFCDGIVASRILWLNGRRADDHFRAQCFQKVHFLLGLFIGDREDHFVAAHGGYES